LPRQKTLRDRRAPVPRDGTITTFFRATGRADFLEDTAVRTGKLHTLNAPLLQPRYPLWKDFLAGVRRSNPSEIPCMHTLRRIGISMKETPQLLGGVGARCFGWLGGENLR